MRLATKSTLAVMSVQAVLIGVTMFLVFFHIFPDIFAKRKHNDYYIKVGAYFSIIVLSELTFFFLFLDFYFYQNLDLSLNNHLWTLILDTLHTAEMFTILGLAIHCLGELSFCCNSRTIPTISFVTLSAIVPIGFAIVRYKLGMYFHTMLFEIAAGPLIGGIIANISLLCKIKSPLVSLNQEEVGRVKYVLSLSCINIINAMYKTIFLLVIFLIGYGPFVEHMFNINIVLREVKYLGMCVLYLGATSETFARYIYPCVVSDIDKEAIQLEYFD